ncbi:MAG: citrate/2-methylcitrate synthase, partial [Gemmataceae bacterium]
MSTSSPVSAAYSPGLEGVIAGETAISTVEDGLRYRGYGVGELVEHCTFEEVEYLLIYGELPTGAQREAFENRVAAARALPAAVHSVLKALPKNAIPLDALRTAVSVLASFDAEVTDNSPDANFRKAERLLGQMPTVIADFFRISKGEAVVAPKAGGSLAANFLFALRGTEATATDVKSLDVSLILYAEHEYNASTFTGRVIVSTMSDLHSGVVGAIGALKGPLHGGANEKVMDVLRAAGGPENAEAWTLAALAKKERIMGFGHRVYKSGDVRAGIIRPYVVAAA